MAGKKYVTRVVWGRAIITKERRSHEVILVIDELPFSLLEMNGE